MKIPPSSPVTEAVREKFMREALKEAKKAEDKGEVPVGAVVTWQDRIVGRGHNQSISAQDPTAHAEIIAVRKASRKLRNYRLPECSIYVTVEPCSMCAGALVWARIASVIYGTADEKAGACGSVFNVACNRALNHRMTVEGGVLEEECKALIRGFFKKRRAQKGAKK
jgi:tRNA(adenine34) deaminase